MNVMKKEKTHLLVDKKFFDCIFEKERKKLSDRLGIPLKQREFTEILYKSNVKFKYPKPPKDKIKSIFPQKRKRKLSNQWCLF